MEGVLGKNKGYEQRSSSWEGEEADSCGQLFTVDKARWRCSLLGAHYSPVREM